MSGFLFDVNIWIGVLFAKHPAHGVARAALTVASPDSPACFCRSTQQSFLRLATTPSVLRAYQVQGFSNLEAWRALEGLLALPNVVELPEPPGVLPLWQRLSAVESASPKLWMDAYLAAFAIAGGLTLVTLDQGFERYEKAGLQLTVLSHPM